MYKADHRPEYGGYALCVMDSAELSVRAESSAGQAEELEQLPGEALRDLFARSQRLWLKQHRLLRIAVKVLMALFSIGIFGLAAESLTQSSFGLFLPAFLIGWGGLLLIATYIPYSIAAGLKVPPEVLLSFPRELIFQKQLAAARRSSGRWLWHLTVVPGLLTLAAMLSSVHYGQLFDPIFWLCMGLFMLLPALLHFVVRDAALSIVLLHPQRDAGTRLAVLYVALAGAYVFTLLLPILFGFPAYFLYDYFHGLDSEYVKALPTICLCLTALGISAMIRHGQRRMPHSYSGGLLPE